jgi:hypothetical protein
VASERIVYEYLELNVCVWRLLSTRLKWNIHTTLEFYDSIFVLFFVRFCWSIDSDWVHGSKWPNIGLKGSKNVSWDQITRLTRLNFFVHFIQHGLIIHSLIIKKSKVHFNKYGLTYQYKSFDNLTNLFHSTRLCLPVHFIQHGYTY